MLPVCTLLLYLPFLTRTYYWDGVLFALDIERVHQGELPASILFHPNHLLYSGLGYVCYSMLRACGIHLRAITVLQFLNVAVSATAGYVLYGQAKRLTRSAGVALFCWLLFTFGATWWKFSTDANSYILSVFLIILAIRFVMNEPPKIVAAAVCHTLAMLFHELAIFVYAPIMAAILLDRRSVGGRLARVVGYGAGTSAVVTAAYLVGYSYADRTAAPTLLRWISSYSHESGFTQSLTQLINLYLLSYVKLFAGGKLIFLRDYFSAAVVIGLIVCAGALVSAVRLYRVAAFAERRPNTAVLWIWLISSALFLAIWDPGSAFHKLFVWPPIVLLIGCYVRTRAALALAIALGAWNFAAFIYPHAHDSAFPVLALARTVDRELPKNATVYYNQFIPDDWYLDYFAPGRRWDQLPVKEKTGPVCMETTALEAVHPETDPLRRWDLINSQHHIRLECLK